LESPLHLPCPLPQSRESEKGNRVDENRRRGKGVSKAEPTENLLPNEAVS